MRFIGRSIYLVMSFMHCIVRDTTIPLAACRSARDIQRGFTRIFDSNPITSIATIKVAPPTHHLTFQARSATAASASRSSRIVCGAAILPVRCVGLTCNRCVAIRVAQLRR